MTPLPVVLLILFTSNTPQGNMNDDILLSPTAQPQKGFADSGKSPKNYDTSVNDLTAADFKFPDDHVKVLASSNEKVIREKLLPEEKNEKSKAPVPLYSLVKNDCGDGYALDENGVCQKTISVKSGKNLDAERRKRDILSYEWLTQKNQQRTKRSSNEKDLRMTSVQCKNLYPGLVADENGGCRKAVGISEQPFDKTLPP